MIVNLMSNFYVYYGCPTDISGELSPSEGMSVKMIIFAIPFVIFGSTTDRPDGNI